MADTSPPDPVTNVTPFIAPASQPNISEVTGLGVKLNVGRLLTEPTRPVDWMVNGLLPKKAISIFSGVAYLGKSYLGMELGIALASGRPFLGKFPIDRKYRVGYFDLEMMREDTERRYQRMLKMESEGVDWANLHIFAQSAIRIDEKIDGSFAALKKLISAMKLEIVIIDSLRRMHLGDDKDSKQADMIFSALKAIRDAEGCASAMIAHWRKASGESNMNDASERLAGSADYRNFVDAHICAVKHHAPDHMTIFPDKTRQTDGAPAKFVVRFEHRNRADPDGPFHLILTETPPKESAEDRMMEKLLATHPSTIAELAKASKVNVKTAHRIINRWRKTGECTASKDKPMMISPGAI